ncbi:MAG: ABC transporter permease [Hyphomicrobiales bacterium]|nr:ABC transporter permease [Hyphomicrobiales bacterium]
MTDLTQHTIAPDHAARATGRWSVAHLVLGLACLWLAGLAVLALTADLLPFHDPLRQDYDSLNASPSLLYPIGTDSLGRDILSRIVHGARISLTIALAAPTLGLLLGVVIGMTAGYFGGRLDATVGILIDAVMAFPNIIFATVVVTFAGASLPVMIAVIAFYTVPRYVRVARATTLAFAGREFVFAAKALGAGELRILVREILPNVLAPIGTITLTLMSFAVIIEGGLSFLGIGIPAPTATWGGMIAEGIPFLSTDPKISLVPAATIFLTVLSLNLIGEHLRSAAEVKAGNI